MMPIWGRALKARRISVPCTLHDTGVVMCHVMCRCSMAAGTRTRSYAPDAILRLADQESMGAVWRRSTPEQGGETVFPQGSPKSSGEEWSGCAQEVSPLALCMSCFRMTLCPE